jgi:alkylated DNA repair dioxygenase AlkB
VRVTTSTPAAAPRRPARYEGVVLPEGFTLFEQALPEARAEEELRALVEETPWEDHVFSIYGRAVPMPRRIAMYGPVGYRYSGVVHPPRALGPRLEALRALVEARTGRRFNSVLLNLYRDGGDGVSWHRDSDFAHGGQPDVASVSLGATRRFELSDRRGRRRLALDLHAGSILLMTGEALRLWWHRVPKTAAAVGPRINLTFRHMVAATTR